MTIQEHAAEALARARGGQSLSNYGAIVLGFMERGIPEDQILPRENIFTYAAWRALGRQVRKGEHGIKVATWIPMTKTDKATGEKQDIGARPRSVAVFHVSQTDPVAV